MNAVREFIRTTLDTIVAYAWWTEAELLASFGRARKTRRPSNSHALVLAWVLPPTVYGGVYRPTSFLKYGTEFGWRMSAISGPAHVVNEEAGRYLLDAVPDSVRIDRVEPPALSPSWRFFPRIDGGFLNALATVSLARRKFALDPPAVVIASGPPFHNFVAAYFIARFFGAKLVLDYRDEWTEGTREFIESGNVDRFWEARCLRAADAIFFATKTIQDLYLGLFPRLKTNRCHILHNGWEPAEFMQHRDQKEEGSGRDPELILSYVGNSGEPLPGHFLTCLLKILMCSGDLRDRVQVRFVGRKPRAAIEQFASFERGIPGILDLVEHVPKPEAIRIMRESSALLLLNNPHIERALTGKLFDYLASGRPLLVYGDTGEIGNLMGELKAGVVVPVGDPDALEQALLKLRDTPASQWQTPARDEFLRTHTREVLAGRMFEILEQL